VRLIFECEKFKEVYDVQLNTKKDGEMIVLDKKNMITHDIQALGDVFDGAGLVVKFINIDEVESLVTLIVECEKLAPPSEKILKRKIAKIVKIGHGYKGMKLQVEAAEEAETFADGKKVKYITVTSGKGGVGKSTVSANLAVSLARLGKKVGLIDADIYGPSLPQIFGVTKPDMYMSEEQKVVPPMVEGVAVMSTEFLLDNDQPLMWRGPMLGSMLKHFFNDVLWDEELDYILVDLPPGTGDVPMDIKGFIPSAKAIVVTTPHKMAAHIAVKSGEMAKHLGHELLGVVENMSYFKNPVNDAEEKIFGSGGAEAAARKLDVDVLASIPIGQPKEGGSDSIFAIHEEIGIEYLGLANRILKLF